MKKMPSKTTGLNRRRFLRLAGASVFGVPLLVPARVLAVPPGETIGLGLIGCGGRMEALAAALARCAGTRIAAVCDVRASRREAFRKAYRLRPRDSFRDFRELLARPDIDAVAVATPDHWHVPIALAAVKAGKDVYCEKPLSNTVAEGRLLVEAVRRSGAVFQHGTQLHSYSGVRRACELVRSGRIGRLRKIVIGSPPGRVASVQPPMAVPPELDYDMWLGPAPWAPYTRARVFHYEGFPGWYFISDYSKSGWIAGYGVHDLDIAHWGMGMERSGPVWIEGRAEYPRQGLFDTPITFQIEFRYPNGVTLEMTDTGRNRHGVRFVGEEGWIFTRGGIEASPERLLRERLGPGDARLYAAPNHAQNFIDCVRSRRETITPPEIAHRATSAALLAGIACRLGRPLRWDPEKERFLDDPVANRLLACAWRKPWDLFLEA